MFRLSFVVGGTFLGVVLLAASHATAQQAGTGVPQKGASNSFSERFGSNWGARGRGWSFSFGGGGGGMPTFGGYQPGAGATGGFQSIHPGRGSFSFGFEASQGNQRTATSTTPMLTTMNGYPGSLFYGSIRPFVMGVIPVVGGYGGYPAYGYPYPYYGYAPYGTGLTLPATQPGTEVNETSPAARALRQWQTSGRLGDPASMPRSAPSTVAQTKPEQDAPEEPAARAMDRPEPRTTKRPANERSSAERSAPSVARARELHATEQVAQQRELEDLFRQGQEAEAAGDRILARAFYRKTVQRAEGSLKQQARQRLLALQPTSAGKTKPKR
ncbi:MAG: hypothetical protein JW818_04035 [Pirellulales bacterium]|nr:hypothetical protein [Pirellulales bacterium]